MGSRVNMKKSFLTLIFAGFVCFFACGTLFAEQSTADASIQNRIQKVGTRILKSNRITNTVTFVYDPSEKSAKLSSTKMLVSRKITVYSGAYKNFGTDEELAAFLARNIALVVRSYDGVFSGRLRTLQIKAAPKKYQIVADKIAADYMVKAGYDPVALIVLIQKVDPQKKYSAISSKNSTSKRLAVLYEYIFSKYPYYLLNNKYYENTYYQQFLTESEANRKLLEQKLKSHSTEELDYE